MADPDRLIWDRMLSHLRENHAAFCRQWFSGPAPPRRGQRTVQRARARSSQAKLPPQTVHRPLQRCGLYRHRQAYPRPLPRPRRGLHVRGTRFGPEPGRSNPPVLQRQPEAPHAVDFQRYSRRFFRFRPRQTVPNARRAGFRGRTGGQAEASFAEGATGLSTSFAPQPAVAEHRVEHTRREDSLVINPDHSFENFVVGPDNRLANAASHSVGSDPGKAYNPLFIHGDVGLGKTHLLQAICLRILETNPAAVLYYISCETFVTQFIDAVQAGEMNDFRHRFRDVNVLVIDDIHFLTRRDRTQEEFFHTFNCLHHDQRQIVLSSDAPPRKSPTISSPASSAALSPGWWSRSTRPATRPRVAILKTKARLESFADEVACYIAGRIDSNIRELEGTITKVQILGGFDARAIDVDLAKAALGDDDSGPSGEPSIQSIIDTVTQYYRIKVTELQSKRRPESVVLPRQVCMYLARRHTRHSLEEIGGYFGGRDHTTVMHAIRTIETKLDDEAGFQTVIKAFEDRLRPTPRTAPIVLPHLGKSMVFVAFLKEPAGVSTVRFAVHRVCG